MGGVPLRCSRYGGRTGAAAEEVAEGAARRRHPLQRERAPDVAEDFEQHVPAAQVEHRRRRAVLRTGGVRDLGQ